MGQRFGRGQMQKIISRPWCFVSILPAQQRQSAAVLALESVSFVMTKGKRPNWYCWNGCGPRKGASAHRVLAFITSPNYTAAVHFYGIGDAFSLLRICP